ncbi:MAG: cold shock domain-containing protein [Holophagales bacterium]|nr:cold shock domain-containing protein [Holophagales bacterium]
MKCFNPSKAFGVLTLAGGSDVFVPSAMWSGSGREPRPGDLIRVTCERSARGPRATTFAWR